MPKSSLAVFVLVVAGVASQAAGDCTRQQKAAADAALRNIQVAPALRDQLVATHAPYGLHSSTVNDTGQELLVQGGYLMVHDRDLRTSLWVTYRLTDGDVEGADGAARVECFREDPRLSENQRASTTDYLEPVFDRGHLASDADLKDNFVHQLNSYMMSNMSPQHCRFNRGVWLSLEHLTRRWAEKYGEIIVTSGAVFDRDGMVGRDTDEDAVRMRSNNGRQRVAVPSHFYKVIVRGEGKSYRAISFLLKHDNRASGVGWDAVRPVAESFISSISEIEATASVILHPEIDRTALSENREAWDFGEGRSNAEASCPEDS